MLQTIFGSPRRATLPEGWFDGLWGTVWPMQKTQAGVTVNHSTAMTYAAVWAATRVLCEPAGAMPLITYRRTSRDDREPADDYPIYDLLKSMPNDEMDSQPFWEGRFQHAINWDGGGFAEIVRESEDEDAPAVELYPIHPSRIRKSPTASREASEGYYYLVKNDDGTEVAMRARDVFHMPGVLSEDGIWSRGVIPYARQTIGFGLATETYGATYFGSGGVPRVIVTGFQPFRDASARKTFRQEWKEAHGNAAADDVGLAPPGTDIKVMSIPNEAAQFLQTRVHNDRVIARWYMVPLHMIQDLEKANYASIELVSMEFVIYHLWPWLRRCQGQCNLKLIPEEDRRSYYVEHNLNTLLRGDLRSRIDSYRTAIMIGVLSINEARRFENLPGIGPAGDVHYVPANMTTAEVMLTAPPVPGSTPPPGSDANGEQGKPIARAELPALEHSIDAIGDDVARNGHERPGLKPAIRGVLVDVLSRMYNKERQATKTAAGKRDDFGRWSEDYYFRHRDTLTEALGPAAELLRSSGMNVTAGGLADRSIRDSKARIEAALAASPATLVSALDSWPTERADAMADEILKGNP